MIKPRCTRYGRRHGLSLSRLVTDFLLDIADVVEGGADAIVTRDAGGFGGLDVPVLTPGAAL